MAANSGSPTKQKRGSGDPNRGIYPPENITQDNCPDCLGLNMGQACRMHPPRWFTQGPKKWLKGDTIKNRHKYQGAELGSPGFDPEEFSEFVQNEEEQRPYTVYYDSDAPLKPHVVTQVGASGRGKHAEQVFEAAAILRGVPNFTKRGGGFRRYRFHIGVTESFDCEFPPEKFCQRTTVFDKNRDPLRRLESDKVVGRGHFSGGGTQVKPKAPGTHRWAAEVLDSDSD